MKSFSRLLRSWRQGARRPGAADVPGGASNSQDVICVPLTSIRFKLLGRTIRALRSGDLAPDDWDLDRRPIEETTKYISVVRHFREGVPWENTPIFKRYAKRLAAGETIRGCRSIEELKDAYQLDMNRLYTSMSEHGFLSYEKRGLRKTDLPHVFIGRDGEIIFGSEGNHRLAIAHVISLGEIPCRVMLRHGAWELKRHQLAAASFDRLTMMIDLGLGAHSDLQDLLTSGRHAGAGNRNDRQAG